MFTRVYLCLLVFTYVYNCLLVLVYLYLPVISHVYSCLHIFTLVYSCFLTFTDVESYLPMFTIVNSCLFTYVYRCLLLFTHIYQCCIGKHNNFSISISFSINDKFILALALVLVKFNYNFSFSISFSNQKSNNISSSFSFSFSGRLFKYVEQMHVSVRKISLCKLKSVSLFCFPIVASPPIKIFTLYWSCWYRNEIKCKTGEERINIFFSCQKLALQDTCSCFFRLLKVFPHTTVPYQVGISCTCSVLLLSLCYWCMHQ